MRHPPTRVTLQPNERLIQVAATSYVLPIIGYVILLALPLGLYAFTEHNGFLIGSLAVLIFGGCHLIHRMQFTWIITNRRTIAQWGILSKHTTSVSHNRITDTSASIPLMAALFGTGSVRISTASNDEVQIEIKHQHNPLRIQYLLNNLKNETQQHPHV